GGYDVLRVDPVNDVPMAGSIATLLSGEGERAEVTALAENVVTLGLNAVTYLADPLNFLINAGLGFLIDVVQPLDDILGWGTRNTGGMDDAIGRWERRVAALRPPAEEIRDASDQGLIGWIGAASEVAKGRLSDFADGVASLSNDVNQLAKIMDALKATM